MSAWEKNMAEKVEELERKLQFYVNKGELVELDDKHLRYSYDQDSRIEELEERVKSIDLDKRLKLDYMLKMNQLVENDKAHQAVACLLYTSPSPRDRS